MWTGGVRGIVLDDKDRMLLVKQHHKEREVWMVPGGGIEEGEGAREAVRREIREETGLDVEVGKLIWHVEEVSDRGQRFVEFFMAKVIGGELGLGEDPEFDEAGQVLREVKFMSKEEVSGIKNLYPEYLRDEFWEIYQEGSCVHDAFKARDKNERSKWTSIE